MWKLKLYEPEWGVNITQSLYKWMMSNQNLIYLMPKLADVFVFTYPVYLVLLYGYGMIKGKSSQEGVYYRKSALFIFTGVVVSLSTNIVVQFFVDKVRPNIVLGLMDNKTESILHSFLPSSSMPSDHAVVSMSIAMATAIWGIKNHDKKYLWWSLVLFVFAVITCWARATTAIHWVTDLIVGSLIGLWMPRILSNKKISKFCDKIFGWIVRIV